MKFIYHFSGSQIECNKSRNQFIRIKPISIITILSICILCGCAATMHKFNSPPELTSEKAKATILLYMQKKIIAKFDDPNALAPDTIEVTDDYFTYLYKTDSKRISHYQTLLTYQLQKVRYDELGILRKRYSFARSLVGLFFTVGLIGPTITIFDDTNNKIKEQPSGLRSAFPLWLFGYNFTSNDVDDFCRALSYMREQSLSRKSNNIQ